MRIEKVTSRKNATLQLVRKLLSSRRARMDNSLFVSDGTKLLEEAVKWYPGLDTVILSDTLPVPTLPDHVKVLLVPEDVMASVSPMEAPQGALFLCKLPEQREMELRPGMLVLDGVQDPGNLGTILRTADALNVPVVLADGCADPYSWKTVRASMGAVFRNQPMMASSEEIIYSCKEKGIPLAVTALSDRAEDIRKADLSQMAAVIGSEGRGVSRLFLDSCDRELIIPMNPRCESLNAAVAATIVMWQMQCSIL